MTWQIPECSWCILWSRSWLLPSMSVTRGMLQHPLTSELVHLSWITGPTDTSSHPWFSHGQLSFSSFYSSGHIASRCFDPVCPPRKPKSSLSRWFRQWKRPEPSTPLVFRPLFPTFTTNMDSSLPVIQPAPAVSPSWPSFLPGKYSLPTLPGVSCQNFWIQHKTFRGTVSIVYCPLWYHLNVIRFSIYFWCHRIYLLSFIYWSFISFIDHIIFRKSYNFWWKSYKRLLRHVRMNHSLEIHCRV